MGAFVKETANIADCVRLDISVPDLKAAQKIPTLPIVAVNDHKDKSVRRKWYLYDKGDYRNAEILDNWRDLDAFISSFPAESVSKAHISEMPPNSFLHVHVDGYGIKQNYKQHYELFNSTLRIHIPLVTSNLSNIYCGGLFYKMKRNECWMLNNFRQHSAINDDPENSRYHLIMDVVPNSETYAHLRNGEEDLGRFYPVLMKKLRSGQKVRGTNRPDFFVLGAMKSGTTSLYHYLKQHPDIAPAVKKELHYYDEKRYGEWTHDDYLAQFSPKKRNQLSFESTVYYLRHPHTPKWIKQDFPTAKFVVLLRNPIDRAYSHFIQKSVKGKETRDFEDCVKNEASYIKEDWNKTCANENHWGEHSQSYSYLARGRYAEQLENWFEYFPRNKFHIVLTDDLAADPNEQVHKTFKFLGIPQFAKLDTSFVSKKRDYEPMSDDIRKWLADYFEPYNRSLEKLLGREIPW